VTASASSSNRRLNSKQIHLSDFGVPSTSAIARTESMKGGESAMTFIFNLVDRLRREEEGQTMAEYGVVLGVITIAAVGAFLLLGQKVDAAIRAITAFLP
jgi:pilus assembly protein Flp/PilA